MPTLELFWAKLWFLLLKLYYTRAVNQISNMKRENLIKAIVLLMADEKRLTPKEIQEKIKDRPPIISIYAALKTMIDRKQVSVRTFNGLKHYSLSKDRVGLRNSN